MGVDGLIRFLQPIVRKEHLSSFRGQTAVVDMMSWLYRACYNAAEEMNADKGSEAFLLGIHQMLDLLSHYQIKMTCVFDGRHLPHKSETVGKRRSDRESNRRKGEELLAKGQQEEGKKIINRCISVDERVISTTMRVLKGREVPFMVAPYESDCQMAKLCHLKKADFVICEDSDLIIYGVPVLLKLSNEGDCDYFDIESVKADKIDNVFIKQFVGLSQLRRTEVAVLAGTDYLPSIKGIGIKTALKYITETHDLQEAIARITEVERFKTQKPQNYEQRAIQAMLIFLFSTSYNPDTDSLELLSQNFETSPLCSEMTSDQLFKLVGEDFGYEESVRNGARKVWTLEERELAPIAYEEKSTLNLGNIKEKELSFENTRLMRNRVRTRSSLKVPQKKEQDLQMMCQTRLAIKKKESLRSLKKTLSELYQADQNEMLNGSLKRLRSKDEQFKDKFPSWMKYCPEKAKAKEKGPVFSVSQ